MITLPSDMDTGRATVEWTKPPQPRYRLEWIVDRNCVGAVMIPIPVRFNPRGRLTGLALRLLAVSNAWRQP